MHRSGILRGKSRVTTALFMMFMAHHVPRLSNEKKTKEAWRPECCQVSGDEYLTIHGLGKRARERQEDVRERRER